MRWRPIKTSKWRKRDPFCCNHQRKGSGGPRKAVHLKCESRETKLNEEDIENLYEVSWADGNKLQLKSGELKAYIDMRDGNDGIIGSDGRASPNCKGIPYYQRKMNEFVRTFALSFNEGIIDTDGDGVLDNIEGHVDGFTLSGNTGIRFLPCWMNTGNQFQVLSLKHVL